MHSIEKNKGKDRQKQKQHSEILTVTPLKVIFEEKARKHNKIKDKKKKGKENNKKKTNDRNRVKKNLFTSNSSDSLIDEYNNEYNEAEVYLSDPFKTSDQTECMICLEEGKNNEIWYRCGKWVHKECSGCNKRNNYICDFCTKQFN